MNCETAAKNFSLFLYGELSIEDEQSFQDHIESCAGCRQAFEAEKAMHELLERREADAPEALLARCRRDLDEHLGSVRPIRAGWREWLTGWPERAWPALVRPAGAVVLVALGFFGARYTTTPRVDGLVPNNEPVVSRVRYLQPEPSGRVQVVIEETRQRMVTGDPGDEQIHRLLLTAAREASDAGLRAESMDILRTRPGSNDLRQALVFALEHDPNPGVRLKALDALKPFATTPEVRGALAKVLLADENPGIRTQAIDLLVLNKEDAMVGLLQELVQKESNTYVRQRCQRALQEMDASVGTF